MANIKSQIKRIHVTARQTERNKAVRSLLKTRIIKFMPLLCYDYSG
ncbi:MAG TPA: 30S ribosomal protein S20 [Actinobacteria bacterium]|nr:30S ribosomal protein S20 [Actinomycetota bacterium]